jgi:Na+/phosphate symporter
MKGGPVMVEELAVQEKFSPLFDKLGAMVNAARDAFNRHSVKSLDYLIKFHGELVPEIKSAVEDFGALASKGLEGQRNSLIRLQSVMTRLLVVGDNVEGLSVPIARKIREGVLFSNKAVAQANQLFDHQAGILRSILDVLKTDNDFLKRYVLEEGQKLVKSCNDFATEHEARLIEGLCLPQAAPLFLAMLDRLRTAGQHEVDIAQILSQK